MAIRTRDFQIAYWWFEVMGDCVPNLYKDDPDGNDRDELAEIVRDNRACEQVPVEEMRSPITYRTINGTETRYQWIRTRITRWKREQFEADFLARQSAREK